ncbi:hypothetical protein [Chryseobacterium sp. MFBS3-17]|uniref:hypothetical protein n=1 Tax=Chryseobacterium sp. MFBS3-17 TaxID=2886689 RepID=UPI001D0F1A46|nr:hypothetical protein [Chryseobacterium sp. MFBS3-17]MCC2590603.1 hypothetical protein [Chryseobacterium sp. MFBS3-17]
MNNRNFVMLFLIVIISCSKNSKNIMNNNEPLSNNQDTTKIIVDTASVIKNNQIEEFQKNVIDKGDIYSFNRLAIHYVDKSKYKELQKYALIMADKYNNGDGYSQVFECIIALNNNNEYNDITDFAKINEKAKNEALKYLEKGASINDINCMSELAEIYRNGIGVEKDIKKADELKKKIEKL